MDNSLNTTIIRIAVIVLVVWAIRKFGNSVIRRAVRRATKNHEYSSEHEHTQREDTLNGIISASLRLVLWVVAGLVILSEFGVNTAPLIGLASVAGLALGFGAQSLVKDFVSGLFIIVENQYRIGDLIEIAGVSGVVQKITLRETIIRDMNGSVHHVPNGTIEVATNKTMEFSGINMIIGVGYDTDLRKVEKVINEVGEGMIKDADWAEKIETPLHYAWVSDFGESQIDIKVIGHSKPGSQFVVAGEFRRRIKEAFDKEKIEIPFPQRVIHTKK